MTSLSYRREKRWNGPWLDRIVWNTLAVGILTILLVSVVALVELLAAENIPAFAGTSDGLQMHSVSWPMDAEAMPARLDPPRMAQRH